MYIKKKMFYSYIGHLGAAHRPGSATLKVERANVLPNGGLFAHEAEIEQHKHSFGVLLFVHLTNVSLLIIILLVLLWFPPSTDS